MPRGEDVHAHPPGRAGHDYRRRRGDALRATAAVPRRRRQRPDVPEHRSVPHRRVGHRDRRSRHAAARPPLHDLRGHAQRRPVEDDERRHHVGRRSPTASASPPSAPSRSRRRIRTSSGWAPATRRTRGRRIRARASSSPPTPARPGSSWGCPTRITSRASSSIRRNPDIVYVAAMGHLFSRNEERGVFRTMDGGKTWKKVLYVNDGVGAIDLVINRKTPDDALRGDVRQGSAAVADRRERTGERHLPDRRRRRQVAKLDGGLPTGQDRPHRPRHLSEEPARSSTRSSRTRIRKPARSAARDGERGRVRSPRGSSATSCIAPTTAARRGRRATRHQRRRRQGAVLVQPDPHQPARRPDRHRHQRLDVHLARRRQDVEHATSSAACSATSARCGGTRRTRDRIMLGSDGGVQRLGRRRQDRRLLPEHGDRRGLRGRRRHGRSLQRLRRLAGSRFVEGPEQRPDAAASRSRTG